MTWSSPLWSGFTQPNKQGFYNEIVRASLQTQQQHVNWTVAPYQRALYQVITGSSDITGGTGKQEGLLLSDCPVFIERIMATCLKSENVGCSRGRKSLEKYHGAWYKGHMKDMLGIEKLTGIELPPSAFLLGMLVNNRADYILTSKTVLEDQLSKIPITNDEIRERLISHEVSNYPLFFGFSDTKRGENIKSIYDKGWRKLNNRGEIGSIYAKFNQEVPVYPGCQISKRL